MRFAFTCSYVCALICTSVSAQILQGFHPERQQPVKLVSPDVTAELIPKPRDPRTGESRSIFRIEMHGRESVVSLPFEFYQVNAILQSVPGKLLVVGMQAGEVYQIGIVDTVESRVADHFACYAPAPSPDGRYVAYTKFFAPHGVPSPDDHAMLYDVARSPSENRPSGIRIDDYIDVGFVVYPPGTDNREADNVDVPPDLANVISGYYLWKDPSQYIFGSWRSGELRVISVTIADRLASVRSLMLTQTRLGTSPNELPVGVVGARFDGDEVTLDLSSHPARAIVLSLSTFTTTGSVDLNRRPSASP